MLNQPRFFDLMDRANKLTKLGDPLVALNCNINWEAFCSDLNILRQKDRKSSAGAKAFDVILMFKILVLQSHINADQAHKLIHAYKVTAASLHDSQVFEELLDHTIDTETGKKRDAFADSAYRSEEKEMDVANTQHRKSDL